MFNKYLIPDKMFHNIYEITPDFLLSKGIKALVCDIDNTLVTYDDPEPTPSVLEWFKKMNDAGISIAFISNNSSPERVDTFNKNLGYVSHSKSGKPSPKFVLWAIEQMKADKSSCAMLGDQLLTDICAGKRAGIYTICVRPIKDKRTPFFRAKRLIEVPYVRKYHKKHPDEEEINLR